MWAGDARTAQDARAFLLGFLQRFPQYAAHPFWITGESYAGHYVPNLAAEILRGNAQHPETAIKLQGFLVGGPLNCYRRPCMSSLAVQLVPHMVGVWPVITAHPPPQQHSAHMTEHRNAGLSDDMHGYRQ